MEQDQYFMLMVKLLQFVNTAAQKESRDLPLAIKKALGFQLQRVQEGENPDDFKPMATVGKGSMKSELRTIKAIMLADASILLN